jgi:hypothetical protein
LIRDQIPIHYLSNKSNLNIFEFDQIDFHKRVKNQDQTIHNFS